MTYQKTRSLEASITVAMGRLCDGFHRTNVENLGLMDPIANRVQTLFQSWTSEICIVTRS
jgi:hypothetical protein